MAFPVYIPFFGLKLHPHAHAFEVRSVKKTCIHIVHPDGRLIPSDTYNLLLPRPIATNAVSAAARLFYAFEPDHHQQPGIVAKDPVGFRR